MFSWLPAAVCSGRSRRQLTWGRLEAGSSLEHSWLPWILAASHREGPQDPDVSELGSVPPILAKFPGSWEGRGLSSRTAQLGEITGPVLGHQHERCWCIWRRVPLDP